MSNTLFPGRPDYVGPQSGYFGLVHHDVLYEWSDGINERVQYIKYCKPKAEQSVRLACLIYIDSAECPAVATLIASHVEYDKAMQQAWAEYQRVVHEANAEYQRVRQAAWAEYQKSEQAAGAESEQAAGAEYEKIRQAWAKCEKVEHKAGAEYEKVEQEAKAECEAYIRRHIPDLPWNGHELVFTKEKR